MPDKILLLPDVVANQIAAGEVVLYPSSVVKEMMENAVDAGATEVTVNFRDGGKELIQVIDNGCGMSPIDARMAFDRHATSKIRQAEDIYGISTFGFRGEALASIAAVAEVEVRTRQRGDDFGTSVEVSGGVFRSQQTASCPEGTQFLVRNLFYNTPARRRFIEATAKESRRVKEEFRRVALSYPGVAFKLYENDAPIYNLPAAPLRGRIAGIMGKTITPKLLDVSAQTTMVDIDGFVGRPAASKQNNREHYLFVNGRYFEDPYLQKAILRAYDKLIPANTKPSYFLNLTIEPDRVDVNVHPQKTRVKFEDAAAIHQIINAAVRESLGKLGATPLMDFDADTSIEIPVHRPGATYRMPDLQPNPDFNPFIDRASDTSASYSTSDDYTDYQSSLYPAEVMQGGFYDDMDSSTMEFIEGDQAEQGSLEIESAGMFSAPVSISERYFAVALQGELMIVDVRRAREAVLFDRYMASAGAHLSASQGLLFPEQAELTMQQSCLVREHADELTGLGFEISLPDEHTAVITAIPADFTGMDSVALLHALIDTMAEEEGSPRELRLGRLAATLAAKGASRQAATDPEALSLLVEQLAACGQSNATPSGLPVMVRITQNEIKRRFA